MLSSALSPVNKLTSAYLNITQVILFYYMLYLHFLLITSLMHIIYYRYVVHNPQVII